MGLLGLGVVFSVESTVRILMAQQRIMQTTITPSMRVRAFETYVDVSTMHTVFIQHAEIQRDRYSQRRY